MKNLLNSIKEDILFSIEWNLDDVKFYAYGIWINIFKGGNR